MNSSSIFDIEPKNGRNRFNVLPRVCYFDTSFILSAMLNMGDKYSTVLCKDFIKQLAVSDSVLAISPITTEEISHVLRQKCVKAAAGMQEMAPSDIDNYIVQNPAILSVIGTKIREVRAQLDKVFLNLDHSNDSSFQDAVFAAMENYGLDTQDARHIALCAREGINSFATVDDDFARTDGFNIFTPNKTTINSTLSRPNIFIPPSVTNPLLTYSSVSTTK